jgi:protein arginine kinase activator
MKCERCGENPAEIDYTEYREGRASKLKICSECARKLGFEEESALPEDAPAGEPPPGPETSGSSPPSPPKIVAATVKVVGVLGGGGTASGAKPESEAFGHRTCPGCGLTAAELKAQSLFGCPRCYETFAEALDPLLKRVHGATTHRGRLPGGAVADAADPDELRRDLREALSREDYETAARIRDRLRQAGEPFEPEGETE